MGFCLRAQVGERSVIYDVSTAYAINEAFTCCCFVGFSSKKFWQTHVKHCLLVLVLNLQPQTRKYFALHVIQWNPFQFFEATCAHSVDCLRLRCWLHIVSNTFVSYSDFLSRSSKYFLLSSMSPCIFCCSSLCCIQNSFREKVSTASF